MPFRSPGGKTFKTRVYNDAGQPVIKSTGTQDRETADRIEGFAKQVRQKRRWDVTSAILSDKCTLAEAYDHRKDLDAFLAGITTPDLRDIVTEWEESGANPRYVTQVRTIVRKDRRFPLSDFRRSVLSVFLKGLKVELATKHRYKAALSAFAQYLIERELIETNPVRDVKLKRAPDAKERGIIYLEPTEVQRLVKAIASPRHRALEALMAGTAMEWQSTDQLYGRDIDFDRRLVHAKGEKNRYRNRWVEFTEDWAWDIFAGYAEPFRFRSNVRLFELDHGYALDVHHNTAEALDMRRTTLHHHRHSYAVTWIRDRGVVLGKDGRDVQWLKNQLGHAPQSQQIFTTYGLFINAARLTERQEERLKAAPAKRSARVAK